MQTDNKSQRPLSEFPLVNFLCKNICEDLGVPLTKVKVSNDFNDSCFHLPIGSSFSNGQIELMKYAIYNSCNAAGRRDLVKSAEEAVAAASGVIQMIYGFSGVAKNQDVKSVRLDQFPVPFLCARNIVSPLCEIKFCNMPILFVNDNLTHNKCVDEVAHVNANIFSKGALDCMVLACFIEMSGHDVKDCFVKLITNRMGLRLLNQLLADCYESDQNECDNFMMMAYSFADIRTGFDIKSNDLSHVKHSSFTAPSFWIFGLIEKMLAPVRGVRDNIAQKWAPISNEIWERIDSRRKEMGLPHAPMEVMLRVQSEPFSSENDSETLQSRLEDVRLWKIMR